MAKVAKKQNQSERLKSSPASRSSAKGGALSRPLTQEATAILASWETSATTLLKSKFGTLDEAVEALIGATLKESRLLEPRVRKELEKIIREDEELMNELRGLLLNSTK